MPIIKFLYPNFKSKCLTFSFDDGVIQDKKFLSYIKNTSFKVTFNLNSGLFSQIKFRDGIDNSRLNKEEASLLYLNHEVASHSLYHFHLENLNYEENYYQIKEDIINLETIFNRKINGFAYPYGKYNNETLKALKTCNIKYARTTFSTYEFSIPNNFLLWNPSIHYNDKRLIELVEKFKSSDEELALFYIWGHTYEFENQNNWYILDYLKKELDNNENIAYLTNIEVYTYLIALKNVIINNDEIYNNSQVDIYLKINDEYIILEANSKLNLKEKEYGKNNNIR